MAITAKEILDLALQMAGLSEVPADSGIYVESNEVKRILVGVDIDSGDLVLAKNLGYDLVLAHHPAGDNSRVNGMQVMKRQIDIMTGVGITINKAQKALAERQRGLINNAHGNNWSKVTGAARALGLPFMNIHMPCDILSENKVQEVLDGVLQPRSTVQDLVDALMTIPEYQNALTKPVIRVGSGSDYCGKPLVIMAGGTNGGAQVAKAYFDAGIGTLVSMHVPEDVVKAVKEQNIGNWIVAGHMASDSIGINLLIAELEKRGCEVTRLNGIMEPCAQ